MVGWIVENRINQGIQVKIYSTLLLHSKERWIIMTSARLQEIKPGHYQGQNTITVNWRSHWQVKEGQILQQVGLNLRI